jgi:hypothetical protein
MLRFATVAPVAIAITLGVFHLMLIAIGSAVGEPLGNGSVVSVLIQREDDACALSPEMQRPCEQDGIDWSVAQPTMERGSERLELSDDQAMQFDTVCIGCCSPDGCRERQVVPIRAPQIVYPSEARAKGLEGDCEVRLDVNPRGLPMRVQAGCSDPVFIAPVETANWKVSFAPKIVRLEPVGRENLVYNVEFSLEEGVICPRQDCNAP